MPPLHRRRASEHGLLSEGTRHRAIPLGHIDDKLPVGKLLPERKESRVRLEAPAQGFEASSRLIGQRRSWETERCVDENLDVQHREGLEQIESCELAPICVLSAWLGCDRKGKMGPAFVICSIFGRALDVHRCYATGWQQRARPQRTARTEQSRAPRVPERIEVVDR